ncbi:hypothetical protein [[Mycoplasma] cavipharyngis]|uniref:hypothetical protein n=1 Tax=[Mycoplasma] cavipharyngis TaxID=92757 RepID=UPI003703E7A5
MPLINSIPNDLIFINPNNLEVYEPSLEISYDMLSFLCVNIIPIINITNTNECSTEKCREEFDTK